MGCLLGSVPMTRTPFAPRLDLTVRTHLGAYSGAPRNAARPLHSCLLVLALDHVEPAELLLRLGERPVGHEPVAHEPGAFSAFERRAEDVRARRAQLARERDVLLHERAPLLRRERRLGLLVS